MTHLRSIAGALAAAMALIFLCPPATGQVADLAEFEPSDVYFQAWVTLREAEKAREAGEFLEAFNKYDKAKQLFDTVALHYPDWKSDLVKDRQQATAATMGEIKEKAVEEQRKLENRTGDLVEGGATPAPRRELVIPELSPDEREKVAVLQQEIMRLRAEVKRAENDRNATAARSRRQLEELQARYDSMARAPVAGQMKDLENRIDRAEQERAAMALALRQSNTELEEARKELTTLQDETNTAKARAAELQKNIDVQQRAAVQVVAGLRDQLKEMQESLREKDKQLAAANVRAAQLDRQLKEARAEILDLKAERDSLLKERDQMAALLKLNESERVQRLIEQNMKLGRELKAAQERVQEIFADNNHTKDELNLAKRDLAIAKAKILDLREENAAQKRRLVSLEDRLAQAGQEVDARLAGGGLGDLEQEEAELLRRMISRQLRIQERRRQAKELVLAEVKRLNVQDDAFQVAFDLFAQQELKLTPEEAQLIQDFKVDEQFIFEDRPNAEQIAGAETRLQQSVGLKEDLARRAFSNRRYLAAREVFDSVLEEHPGHVPTMLNLGVVHLRLDEVDLAIQRFNDAIVIRGDNLPFAHLMLGVSHYQLNDYERSRSHLMKAIDLQPSNARANVYLGNVAAISDDTPQAEHYWREAVRLDATLTEPLYNLALLEYHRSNKDEARKLYNRALRNGAEPDVDFERQLGNAE